MKKRDLTKQKIIATFKELVATSNYSDITVETLIKKAGISRKTFYNHFADKKDLVAYIFKTEIEDKITSSSWKNTYQESAYILCEYFIENLDYYRNIFSQTEETPILIHLDRMFRVQMRMIVDKELGGKVLSAAHWEVLIRTGLYASIALIKNWILSKNHPPTKDMVEQWYCLVMNAAVGFVKQYAIEVER